MFTLELPLSRLLAMLCVAAVNDVRYYLNGVLLEARISGSKLGCPPR